MTSTRCNDPEFCSAALYDQGYGMATVFMRRPFVSNDGIEGDEELSGDGDDGKFLGSGAGRECGVESSEAIVGADGAQR
ncbi:hypothetical protein, partial [Mesorhizobium sp.]|uniref:hypothetical protein n=1 Tax=Mesorhizobium sp. TaxID=1871066 RepID=UPI0025E3A0B1